MPMKKNTMQGIDTVTFGGLIKLGRTNAGLSLSSVAEKLKVTKGYLSRLESGKTVPSLSMVKELSRQLHVDFAQLSILAGHIPADVEQILYENPVEAPALLRETFGEYAAHPAGPGLNVEKNGEVPGLHKKERMTTAKRYSGLYELIQGECFEWLDKRELNSIHAIVTDPPYGLKEFTAAETTKLRNGKGGVWRIPPTLDGYARRPLPRFTVLTREERAFLNKFFFEWAQKIIRVLVPGGHVFIASNPLLSHLVYDGLERAGLEKRGEIIRLVQTLRGGDRPKNAHEEFSDVTVMPRSSWEPWGLFRKPCEGRVQDNLRKWKTGGLRRISNDQPFCDVVKSSPTRSGERDIATHPSLKPQAFMRQIVRAALPLGHGIILDPFMGGGSTIAAACAVGYKSVGIESDLEFYRMAVQAIPRLAALGIENDNTTSQSVSQFIEQQEVLTL